MKPAYGVQTRSFGSFTIVVFLVGGASSEKTGHSEIIAQEWVRSKLGPLTYKCVGHLPRYIARRPVAFLGNFSYRLM